MIPILSPRKGTSQAFLRVLLLPPQVSKAKLGRTLFDGDLPPSIFHFPLKVHSLPSPPPLLS